MARIQLSYQGFGTDSMDIIVPQYGDSRADREMEREAFYNRKFPVLWLLHGGMGCSSDWLRFTEVERFAAEKHLFVVCISGENGCYADMAHGNHWSSFLNGYVWDLIHDMFPLASDRPEDNYIAGLSMGGYGALRNGLAHPEKYGVIGSFSGAVSMVQQYAKGEKFPPNMENVFGDQALGSVNDTWYLAEKLAKEGKAPKVYLACGTKDSLFDSNLEYRAHLEGLGYDLTWDQEDYGHEWAFWNSQIEKFIAFLPEK